MMRLTKSARDSASKNAVVLYNLATEKGDTILKGGNDFKSFALTEDGSKIAFVAERDTTKKLCKSFMVCMYQSGDDSARLLVNKATPGIELGTTVSEEQHYFQ